jgi:hypothetical protein
MQYSPGCGNKGFVDHFAIQQKCPAAIFFSVLGSGKHTSGPGKLG